MNPTSFVSAFLYPDFTVTPHVQCMLNPFVSESECSSDSSSSYSEDDDMRTNEYDNDFKCTIEVEQVDKQFTVAAVQNEIIKSENHQTTPEATAPTDCLLKIPSQNNSLTRRKSSEPSSPLDDLDLIGIILKDGVHRELKSLTLKKECVQESPDLSPVKESSDDTSVPVPNNRVLNFNVSVLESLRNVSLGCFQGKEGAGIGTIPVDGFSCGVYFLYSDEKDGKLITSSKPYAIFDIIEDNLIILNQPVEQKIGKPTGIALTSYVLSENAPDFVIELVKSTLSKIFDLRFSFLTFFDVISENYLMECFEYETNQPMMFNILNVED